MLSSLVPIWTFASTLRQLSGFLRNLSVGSAVLFCTLNMGCTNTAGETASLKGTVKFKGELLPKGAIRLSTEDGTPGTGGLSPITDGVYEIKETSGLKAGKHLVIINAFKPTGRKIIVDEAGTQKEEERQYLPRRYNDDSREHIDISPGENIKDFELTD